MVTDRAALVSLVEDGLRLAAHLGEAMLAVAELFIHFS